MDVTGSFRLSATAAVALALAPVLALAVTGGACADSAPPPAASASQVPRSGPDDSDPWNLVPAGMAAVADLDLAALRGSPWSSSLLSHRPDATWPSLVPEMGYDVYTDVDRVVMATAGSSEGNDQLIVAVGRFDEQKVVAAFAARRPGAKAVRWRESPMWEGAGLAVALVTPRTLAQGAPDTVRAAIDAAWGLTPDAHSGPIGELARGVPGEKKRGAALLVVKLTEEMRRRAQGLLALPPELRGLAVRLDLGEDLDLQGAMSFEDAAQADAVGRLLGGQLGELARRPIVRALGLSAFMERTTLDVRGPRLLGHLNLPAARREELAARLLAVVRAIVAANPVVQSPEQYAP
jgi:hypothetical protein